ncbi:MAG: cytochrome P460 family protein [Spirochaetales bacterium]|nr:cytochrome P460 family protein [Spirochaetales bacterium]
MNKLYTFFYLLCLFLIVACTPEEKEESKNLPPLTNDIINGDKLWSRINSEDNFKDWSSWPDYEGIRPGQSPHGRFHKIYINDVLAKALPITKNIAPMGSIIIKENYDSNKKVLEYTVMAKIEGYNPSQGDWFWGYYQPDGGVKMEGKPAMCIDCHASSSSDFVLLQRLDFGE